MSARRRGLTRRRFIAAASVVPATALAGAAPAAAATAAVATAAAPSPQAAAAGDPLRAGLAIDVLGLDAATRADLEAFAQPVLRETRWLDELPLDGLRPAFVFSPGDSWP